MSKIHFILNQVELDNGVARTLKLWGCDFKEVNIADWNRNFNLQKSYIYKKFVKKILSIFGIIDSYRNQSRIINEYNKQWSKKKFDNYNPVLASKSRSAWIWKDKKFLLSNEGGSAIRLIYLEAVIAALRPKKVLEVGFGNGINLLTLACRFPEIEFYGVEPTNSGYNTALSVVEKKHLPDSLIGFAPFKIEKSTEIKNIFLYNSSSERLPFVDNEFDLVLTSLALEQMEQIRDVALREICRVTNSGIAMLEPFKEVNTSCIRKLYINTFDYFKGSASDLPRYGIEVMQIIKDMPSKQWLGTALVIGRVNKTKKII